eukprot:gnl/TRDRNA2_/TRDRNA2_31383_c0_seq1.p1 gnl/TRDRNA2_/TRDRNA2_31383_c0~~gnl/TRDRNA2_/TRDRNA2_31383_c0_seq1.p1  ORF type:complete len:336 (-),score=31.99 gnl/TRDRNA2_/TRDRNA2_31383_c0_seq1:56-1030(-)
MAAPGRPAWFEWALRTPYEDRHVDVYGIQIHYQLWSARTTTTSPPGIVLVHGGSAHSHWWDWTAPFLSEDCTVAALDLSGHGESDERAEYSTDLNADEVMAVCKELVHLGCRPKPYIVGHSFGGWVCLTLAAREFARQLGGVVVFDSAVPPPHISLSPPPRVEKKPGLSTMEGMLARFRLMPPQDVENQYLLDYIGPLSLRQRDGIYMWKDDPRRMVKTRLFAGGAMSKRLQGLQCRLAVFYGQNSAFFTKKNADVVAYMKAQCAEHTPGGEAFTPVIGIPGAQHHVMFDQPIAVVSILQTLLAEWNRQQQSAAPGEAVMPARL